MFSSIPNEISAASEFRLASQQAFWDALNDKTLENVKKFVHLNTSAVKQSMMNSSAALQQLQSLEKNAGAYWTNADQAPANVGNTFSYMFQAAESLLGMQINFAKLMEDRVDETNQKMMALFDDMAARKGSDDADASKACLAPHSEGERKSEK